ncbi:undecaprenyl-diphosphate phosphatase [Haploplasma axanthum]|nr:undecaprenyl-diphosphate phosphatase [Haploplasma axanthum]
MLEILKYIILGIIQGVTEVFPVSSSGHLTIFSHVFRTFDPSVLTVFLMITNLGSFIALLFFFRKDVIVLIKSFFTFLFNKEKRNDPAVKEDFVYTWKLVVAVIPIGIAGLLLEKYLPTSLLAVGLALLITGVLLFIVYTLRNKKFEAELTWKNAIIIGLFQTTAIMPGISRSGITLIGGLSQKVEIKKVLKFSFLSYLIISVPVSIKGIADAFSKSESINVLGYFLAFVASFLATYITVKILYKSVKVKNLVYFAIYCLLMGGFAIIYHFVR